MPKTKKELHKVEPKKKHAPPVSLYPLTFEQAIKGLLAGPQASKPKKS